MNHMLCHYALMESKSGTRLFCGYTTIQEPNPKVRCVDNN